LFFLFLIIAVASGKLREDLLYRLNVFPIHMPPLRDRMEDVALLAQHFLGEICIVEGEKKSFNSAAMARLQAHRWPGNVRELRNAVHRAYVMASTPVITDEWLSFDKPASIEASGPAINIRIGTALADVERTLILATLKHFDNHRERTAAALGVSLKTLYNRLKEYSADGHGSEGST
jgi:DNA-binding NtrC family response regulator